MNCPKCGVKNSGDENFCQSCGARLNLLAVPAVQVASASNAPAQGINKKLLLAILGIGILVFVVVLALWPAGNGHI